MTITCECSDEYGPCEQHGDTLVVREGASQRTGDEVTMVLISDLTEVGAALSAADKAEYERLMLALDDARDSASGCAWFSDSDDADSANDLAQRVESGLSDLWVIRDDGYRIVRPHADCPLVTA